MHPANCLTFNTLRAARRLNRDLDSALAPLNLTAQQFSILALLDNLGTCTIGGIADQQGSDRTTVTRAVARLRGRALVMIAGGDDRRVTPVALSDTGRTLLDQAMPLWRDAQTASMSRAGSAAEVLTLLRRL